MIGVFRDVEALSTNELIEEIKLPKGLMNAVSKIGGTLHLLLNPERRMIPIA